MRSLPNRVQIEFKYKKIEVLIDALCNTFNYIYRFPILNWHFAYFSAVLTVPCNIDACNIVFPINYQTKYV